MSKESTRLTKADFVKWAKRRWWLISIAIFLLILDWITTIIGLSSGRFYEMNPITSEHGLIVGFGVQLIMYMIVLFFAFVGEESIEKDLHKLYFSFLLVLALFIASCFMGGMGNLIALFRCGCM